MVKPYTYHDRSKLKKEIDYITRPGVEYIDVLNLSVYRGDYAEQLNETYRLYNKRTEKDKAAFYGYIIDYDPRDNPSPKDMHEASIRLMQMTFPDFECVIATHTDTDNVHTHVIMNSVNLVTGKKLKFSSRDLAKMIEDHIRIGESYGYTHTRVTERNPDYRTTAEVRIQERGGWSWKDDIRNFVRGAVEDIRVTTPENFMAYLLDYNMEVLDIGNEFLYFHPKMVQGVRGKKLGPYYTRKSVMAAIEKNREEAERREAEKTPSITRLDEYNKIEVWFKFGERVAKEGRQYNDFNKFVRNFEEGERAGTLKPKTRECMEYVLRNPVTGKDYGELTSVEFYRERRYALFCEECQRDNVSPLSRDIFYRDNGWEGAENIAEQETVGQEDNKAVSIDMLDDYTKVAVWLRYAKNELRTSDSYCEINSFIKITKDNERKDCVPLSVWGYIEVGLRNPLTEKDYGKLSLEEFYHENMYDLNVFFCEQNNEIPWSKKEFYSHYGWNVPESLVGEEVASQEVASQEVASQEVASQEVASQEVASRETEEQDTSNRETASQEVEKEEIPQTSSINQLDVYNKIAVWFSYAERKIKQNNSYYDFNDFVEKVEEIERRGNRVVYVSDCIDDAIKNPLTEKNYGKLSANDFYCGKVYALYCEECQRDSKTPLSRDDFYRDNGWTVSEPPVSQEFVSQKVEDREDVSWEVEASEDVSREVANQESEKPVSISQLDDYSKVSAWFEYAKNQVKWGSPYHDFLVFETYIQIHEKSGTFAIGQEFVEEAFRHPTTKKEYGKLDSTEFYHEKRYELYLIECAKDKKSPLSREEFYRENVWRVPKCLAKQCEAAADGVSEKPADGISRGERSSAPDAVGIDRLDERSRFAVWFRYAEDEVKEKRSYPQYQDFIEKVREDEKAGQVEEPLNGYIKEGFKNSTIEKGYEGLNAIELYYELNYVLYVDTCVRDGKIPCGREKYYLNYGYRLTERLKNRPDGAAVATIGKMPFEKGASSWRTSGQNESRADAASENPASPKQNAVSIEMLDEYTKVAVWARYSEDLINAGEQIYSFGNFVDWVKDAESKESLPPDLKDYIEEGIKSSATEKDYGKLSPDEFFHEKDYALECLFRRLHYRSSVSKEEYYRQKGWTVPDSLKKRRDDYMGK